MGKIALGRRLYESKEDLAKEEKVKALLEKKWQAILHKLPISYNYDYLVERNGHSSAWVEVKVRTNPMKQYDTMMVSLHKLLAGKHLTDTTGLPCFLVVQWTDATGFVNINECASTLKMGGRADRNDSQDRDPCLYIDIDQFQELKQ